MMNTGPTRSDGPSDRQQTLERPAQDAQQSEKTLQEMLHESQEREAEISALLRGSRAVLEYREFQDAARSIFDACKEQIGATSGYVALLSSDGAENEVLFLDSGGLSCTVDPLLPMPIRGLREAAYRTGKAVYHNDFAGSEWTRFLPAGHVRLQNVLFVPLVVASKVVGLLGIANKPGGFSEHDVRMASTFGELAAIALMNSRTLESLESSEERLRSVTQSANDGIISADRSGNIVFWNEAAAAMFGYSADEIIGKPLRLLMPERFREPHRKGMERAVATGEPAIGKKAIEVIGRRSDGGEFPIELSLATWKTKEGTFFTGILRDITDRKRAEEEITRLAKFPDEDPNPVLRISSDGTVLYGNKASSPLLKVWGCREGESLSGRWRRSVFDALAAGQSRQTEFECGDRVFSLTFAPVADLDYVNVYALDVTDRERARRALELSHHILEIANRHSEIQPLLDEFVAEFKRFTGCAAVGIRLLDDDGTIPYRASDGFDQELFASEDRLSIETDQCICISVAKGAIDAKQRHCTEGGSFYVNAATRFLAAASEEEERQARWAWYELGHESVALVPIRMGRRVLGLVHVADPREDAVPSEVVEALENAAMQLGTAIQRARAEEALQKAHGELETKVRERTAELARANQALQAQITERKRLEEEVLRVGTQEQQRIGQQLHDQLGQQLLGLGMMAKSLQKTLQAKSLPEADFARQITQAMSDAQNHVRAIIKGVYPVDVDANGLMAALADLAGSTQTLAKVSCTFLCNQPVPIEDNHTATQLFHVASEAVRNAVKHARAEHIVIGLEADGGRLTLSIRDDGVGIQSKPEPSTGMGLRIMQYRAGIIGATLEIGAAEGGGTLLTCTLRQG